MGEKGGPGRAEVGLRGEIIPMMVPGQTFWRDSYLPAGVAAVVTPMNFIYGISGIQIAGAYLSGCPFIYKGHPFAALTNTTLIRMLLAAGADPRGIQKVEGFGPGVQGISKDHRVAVVPRRQDHPAPRVGRARPFHQVRHHLGHPSSVA